MRHTVFTTMLFLLALGILWPCQGMAKAGRNQPMDTLADNVVRRLSESPEYANLDFLYENNKTKRGEEWTKRLDAQALFQVREEILAAARSANIEINDDGSKVVYIYLKPGEKIKFTSVVPSEVENNATARLEAGGAISRFISKDFGRDANYQSVMAAIATTDYPPLPGLSLAQVTKILPADSLPIVVLETLSKTPEYAKLDLFYENNKRDLGLAWVNSPQAQAIDAARHNLQKTALTSSMEKKPSMAFVLDQGGKKTVLSSLIPSSVEKDPSERASAANLISRLILEGVNTDAKYLSLKPSVPAVNNPTLYGYSAAQALQNIPPESLPALVLKTLSQTPEYARLDGFYENNKRDQGAAWVNSPLGQTVGAVRDDLNKAALSPVVEPVLHLKVVVIIQGDKKTVLDTEVASRMENDSTIVDNAAALISSAILDNALADANYQTAMAAIFAAENPPLPDINRSATTMVLGAFVDPPTQYPLWLPEPGISTKAELLPMAEKARQRGLAAAGSGDWPAAVAAFKEANEIAPFSPPLMFNLGLAYQRGGWPLQAAMWYRAYLAALPEAANAASLRITIQQLITETEARSLREFDEAERLADLLSDTPSSAGARSLRQDAFESMAVYAFMGGLVDRGEALVRKAATLPGANEVPEKRKYPDKHGLYAAAYSWDAKRVDDIIARYGNEYTPEEMFNYQINVWGNRGDLGKARKVVELYPAALFSDNGTAVYNHSWIDSTKSYDILKIKLVRKMDGDKKFDQQWYMGTLMLDLQDVFWNGRPDIAQQLARRALEYYRKFNPTADAYSFWGYIIPNALLGDRKAIEQEMARWKSGSWGGDSLVIAALFAASSMAPADAEETIMAMLRWKNKPTYEGGYFILEDNWPLFSPDAYFALAIAKGDSPGALKYLERALTAEYQGVAWRALRFAVATGRSQLAFDLSEKLSNRASAIKQLNRLAANPGASESVRERVRRYTAAMSSGWRPSDANHARKVAIHLKHAAWLKDEKQYGVLSEGAENLAKEKPEKLPADMAAHAIVLWMGAMAARVED